MNIEKKEITLKWKFEKISEMASRKRLYSDVFMVDDKEWRIYLKKRSNQWMFCGVQHGTEKSSNEKDDERKSDSDSDDEDINKNNEKEKETINNTKDRYDDERWFCEAQVEMQIMKQTEDGKNIVEAFGYVFENPSRSFEKKILSLSWYNERARLEDFLKDDCMTVKVNLSFTYFDFSRQIPRFTDLTLNVKGTEFYVNKGFLCSNCDYFYDLFVNKVCEDTTIHIDNWDPHPFKIFLGACHLVSDFDLHEFKEGFDQILRMATEYGAKGVHKICEDAFVKDEDDIMFMLRTSDKYGYERLMEKAIKSLDTTAEVKEVLANEDFDNFKETTKVKILFRLVELV